jgi:hypothetical protein
MGHAALILFTEIVGDVFLTTPAAASGYPHITVLRKGMICQLAFFFGNPIQN